MRLLIKKKIKEIQKTKQKKIKISLNVVVILLV